MSKKTIPLRSEQLQENCWAVTDIFASDAAWEQELESCQNLPAEIASYAGRLG